MGSPSDRSNEAYGRLLAAEAAYLQAGGWVPHSVDLRLVLGSLPDWHTAGASYAGRVYWSCPPSSAPFSQDEAVSLQKVREER